MASSSAQYYYDKCMPMGCASSCKTFEAFSTAVEWIAQEKLSTLKIEKICFSPSVNSTLLAKV